MKRLGRNKTATQLALHRLFSSTRPVRVLFLQYEECSSTQGHTSWRSCDGRLLIANTITSVVSISVVLPFQLLPTNIQGYILRNTDNQLKGFGMLTKVSEIGQSHYGDSFSHLHLYNLLCT